MNYIITIAIFPSLLIIISSTQKCQLNPSVDRIHNDLFVPILFLLFNIFDFIGRLLAMFAEPLLFTPKNVWIPAVARIVFIPLFMMCNIQRPSPKQVVFRNDAAPFVLITFFALTSGYIGTCAMMFGASLTKKGDESLSGNS